MCLDRQWIVFTAFIRCVAVFSPSAQQAGDGSKSAEQPVRLLSALPDGSSHNEPLLVVVVAVLESSFGAVASCLAAPVLGARSSRFRFWIPYSVSLAFVVSSVNGPDRTSRTLGYRTPCPVLRSTECSCSFTFKAAVAYFFVG